MNPRSLRAGAAFVAAISLIGCSRQEVPAPLSQSAVPAEITAPTTIVSAPAATPRGIRRLDPVASAPYATSDDHPLPVRQRSKKKSAAIIGGSAAAGAAIGALAGGGKGAGIGAIVGGVGGLVYDRSTAKKREPAR